MQTTLPRLLPETRQIFCTEHKVSKVHEISAEAENHHVFAFHFVSPALVSLCGSQRAVRVKTSTPSARRCVCTPFSSNQA